MIWAIEFFINGKGGDLFKDFFKKFEEGKWVAAMQIIIGVVSSAIKEIAASITEAVDDLFGGGDDANEEKGDQIAGGFTQFAKKLLGSLGESIIAKYKVRIASVIAAWTDISDEQSWRMGAGVEVGAQVALSQRWHVTASGGYEWVAKYSLSAGPDRVEIDLSGYQLELAIGRSF